MLRAPDPDEGGCMMTKELLSQYIDLKEEIKMLESRLAALQKTPDQYTADSVQGSLPEAPYTKYTVKIQGYDYEVNARRDAKIRRLSSLIARKKEECIDKQIEIQEFINSIPDSRTRRVFTYRYIDGMSWQRIAFKLGKHDESYPRLVIHDKYLKNILQNPKNPILQ
jgi:hypothetical protein